ncbi:hypothetical protein Tco_0511562 [Tanacetum coccineum]
MSSITAQQIKLDLELVPKEKRLKIGKCNKILNPGKIQREPAFQGVLDALALTSCYSAFLIIVDVPEVYMHQLWDSVYKHDTFYRFKMNKRKRFKLNLEIFRDILRSALESWSHWEINSLNDVVVDQMHQPWRTFAALINKSLSGQTTSIDKLRLFRVQILWGIYHQKNVDYVELLWEDFIYQIDNKAYKKQEKINKIGMHTSRDDYLTNTLRFVFAKEATQIYGAILPESLTNPEMKETKAYKTYLGFATGATPPKKARKFKKPASPQLTIVPVSPEEPTGKSKRVKRPTKKSTKNESGSESDQDENEEEIGDDEEEVKDESVKTPSNDSDDEDETKITDKAEGDEDEEMDYTTSQLYDDVDIRLNEPVDTDKGFIQEEVYSTAIPQSLPSFTPLPQQSTSTPPPTTEATNPPSTLPDFASVFQFNKRVTSLEKEVAELKKDPLHTQVTDLVNDHLDARLGATRDEFMNFLSASQSKSRINCHRFCQRMCLTLPLDKSESYLAAPEHRECFEELIKSYDLDKTIFSTYGKVYSLKRSRKDKDKDEDPSAGSDRGLKKRKTSKDAEPTKGPKAKESQSSSSKGTKSQPKSSRKSVQLEEPEFEVADSDMPQDQEENPGNDDEEPKEKVAPKHDWFTKPTQPQEPTDPDWNVGKTPQQGQNQSWLMTLASSAEKPSKTFENK